MSWESVACCDDCWWSVDDKNETQVNGRGALENGVTRFPLRMAQEVRRQEACHFCGWTTFSGIYIRVDTTEVPAAGLRVRPDG
jgi:hypothetical protein